MELAINCAGRYNGWFATGVSSFILAGTLSPMAVYGILFVDIGNDLHCSTVQTGLVASVCFAMSFMMSPFSGYLNRYISHRSLVILGSTLAALSILASCFANSFLGLLIPYGVFYGLGSNFATHGVLCILFQHFPDENRTLSVGIAMCGATLGTLTLTIVYGSLLPWRGWRGALGFTSLYTGVTAIVSSLILSGQRHENPETVQTAKRRLSSENEAMTLPDEYIAATGDDSPNSKNSSGCVLIEYSEAIETVSHHCTSASMDRVVGHTNHIPPSSEECTTITQGEGRGKSEVGELNKNLSTWKGVMSHGVSSQACMVIFLSTLPWAVYYINIVSYFKSVQVDGRCLSNLLTVIPVFELFGKVGIGLLEKYIKEVYLLAGQNVLFIVVSAVLALFPVYKVLTVCTILIGAGRASFLVLSFSVMAQLLPTNDPDKAVTATMVATGLGFTLGTLPAGAIYDGTGSYKYAILLNMVFYFLGAFILLFTVIWKSFSQSGMNSEVPLRRTATA